MCRKNLGRIHFTDKLPEKVSKNLRIVGKEIIRQIDEFRIELLRSLVFSGVRVPFT
jgi:hypothetical protein